MRSGGWCPFRVPPWLPASGGGLSGLDRDHPAHSVPPWKMTVAEDPQKQHLAVTHPYYCLWGQWGCLANAEPLVLGLQEATLGPLYTAALDLFFSFLK